MKFGLFYEIPVARPWTRGQEHKAYKDVVEQAVLGDQVGFHSIWTVEHHFLEEFSHCSNRGGAVRQHRGAHEEPAPRLRGAAWSMPKRRVLPKPLQDPHPPLWGAATSVEGHYEIGKRGIGVCSFTVGEPPGQLVERVDMFRKGQVECEKPAGAFVNDRVATFTMVHAAESNERAHEEAGESMAWYPSYGGRMFAETARWIESLGSGELGTYAYMENAKNLGEFEVPFDYIKNSGAAVVGDPDRCIEIAKRYEAVGCDLLLCLLNPYKIEHEATLRSIELLGKYVIPELDG